MRFQRHPAATSPPLPALLDGEASWRCCPGRFACVLPIVLPIDEVSPMNKIVAILISALFAATAFAQTAPDPQPQPAQAAPAPAPAPPPDAKAKPDQGVRKLSRRERKDRIKSLGEKYRQFLNDVDPIMNPAELDTFLILETDPQRDIYITEFWRRRYVANGTTNRALR